MPLETVKEHEHVRTVNICYSSCACAQLTLLQDEYGVYVRLLKARCSMRSSAVCPTTSLFSESMLSMKLLVLLMSPNPAWYEGNPLSMVIQVGRTDQVSRALTDKSPRNLGSGHDHVQANLQSEHNEVRQPARVRGNAQRNAPARRWKIVYPPSHRTSKAVVELEGWIVYFPVLPLRCRTS